MKKSIFISAIFIGLVAIAFGQSVITKPLYKLKAGDRILFENEHRLRFANEKENIIFFIERKINNKTQQIAVYNGVESMPYEVIIEPELKNFAQSGHFLFIGQRNRVKYYVNVDGKEFGPFDEVEPKGNCCFHLLQTISGHFAFSFRIANDWKLNIDGQIIDVDQPTDYRFNLFELYLLDNGDYTFVHFKDGKSILNINGTEISDVSNYERMNWDDSKKIAMQYTIGDDNFVYCDKQKFGPYRELGFNDHNTAGYFIFEYKQNDQSFVNVSGRIFGPYERISDYFGVKIDNDKNYYFSYLKNNLWYINVNGKDIGAFTDYHLPVNFINKKLWYTYRNEGKQFVFYNEKIYGPFEKEEMNYNTYSVSVSPSNVPYFVCKKDGNYFLHIEGNLISGYNRIFSPLVYSKTNFMFAYIKDDKYFINANNKTYGPFDMISSSGALQLAENGSFAAVVKRGENEVLLVNGNEIAQSSDVDVYGISPSGNYVYRYKKGETRFVVANGKEFTLNGYINGVFWDKNQHAILDLNTYDDGQQVFTGIKILKNASIVESSDLKNLLIGSSEQVIINGIEMNLKGGYMFNYDESSKNFYWLSLLGSDILFNSFKVND